MMTTQTASTPQNSWRWYLAPFDQKSMAMMRRPFIAWNTMSATSTTSPSAMIGFLYVPMTALYASGDTLISAVSSTCTNRKKKMATPVMR